MGFRELNIDLTDEQKATRDMVRKFGVEVIRPAGIELDKLHDPQDVVAKGSVLWDVFRKHRELDLHKRVLPAAVGGLEQDPLTGALVAEEMGWADAALGISLDVSVIPFHLAMLSPDPEVQDWTRQYCEDTEVKMIGCWAVTEPDHGSDWIHFEGEYSRDPKCAPSVRAVLDGDEYVINGQKSAWVSNGTIATHAALFLSLDPSAGMWGGGVAVIPLALPGISRGKPVNKMGQRALDQGEIFFDDVRIPKSMMVVEDAEAFRMTWGTILAGANAGMGNTFVGTAQAALDEAVRYAKERVQGARPIFHHQNVQLKLFDMFMSVEAARSLARQVSIYNRVTFPPAPHYSTASKVFATETAFRVASHAIQIFGGYGLCKEYLIEKIFRDARVAMIQDGVNESLAIAAADNL